MKLNSVANRHILVEPSLELPVLSITGYQLLVYFLKKLAVPMSTIPISTRTVAL
jgi:hypothetical protein